MNRGMGNFFLERYGNESYIQKRLVRSFVYFNLALCAIVVVLGTAVLIFMPSAALTSLPVIAAVIITLSVALALTRRGRYLWGANFMTSVIFLALMAGLYGKVETAPHSVYTSTFYFLIAGLVFGSFFCSRRMMIAYGALAVVFDVAIYALVSGRLEGAALDAAKLGAAYSSLAIVLVAVISIIISRLFMTSMERLKEESDRNLGQFALLKSAIESTHRTSRRLTGLSGQLSHTSETFRISSQNQAASVEEITATTEEVSAGIDAIGRETERQNDDLNDLAERMRELSRIIGDVGKETGEMMRLAAATSDEAQTSGRALEAMSGNLNKIVESSGDITNIIGMINDISDRINLLSLNAAIEAARAGEAGRGFAVVADEVSKLADQTATSIKDIDALIRSNNDEITRGMGDIMSLITRISSVIDGINTVTDRMQGVYRSVENQLAVNASVSEHVEGVRETSHRIRMAVEEQRHAFEEILKSIAEINSANQLSVREAEKIADGAREVTEMAGGLESSITGGMGDSPPAE